MTAPAQQRIPLPDNRIEVLRLPRMAMAEVPDGVAAQARFPAGGRLRFHTNTSQLHLRVQVTSDPPGHGIDLYVDGAFWRSVQVPQPEQTVTCFEDAGVADREITLCLPLRQSLRVLSVSVDGGAQGIGASRSGMSHAAILARRLGLDFVNLGLGGAGKAEPVVVSLVSSVEACCSASRPSSPPASCTSSRTARSHGTPGRSCARPWRIASRGREASARRRSGSARSLRHGWILRRRRSSRRPGTLPDRRPAGARHASAARACAGAEESTVSHADHVLDYVACRRRRPRPPLPTTVPSSGLSPRARGAGAGRRSVRRARERSARGTRPGSAFPRSQRSRARLR